MAIKDATGDTSRVIEIKDKLGAGFAQLSGDDMTTADYLGLGGHGSISVTSNIAPFLCAQLHKLHQEGRENEMRRLDSKLMPLHKALFFESSPQPAKYALFRMGMCSDEMRLPLVRASRQCRNVVDEAIVQLNLIMADYEQPETKSA